MNYQISQFKNSNFWNEVKNNSGILIGFIFNTSNGLFRFSKPENPDNLSKAFSSKEDAAEALVSEISEENSDDKVEEVAREAESLELEAECQRIEAEAEEAEAAEKTARLEWALSQWTRLRGDGNWHCIETQNNNFLVFRIHKNTLTFEWSDGEEITVSDGQAVYIAPDGELLREIDTPDVEAEVLSFALLTWDNPEVKLYTGTVWRQHFVASGRDYQHFDLAEEMARRVDFTELETPEQVWAYLEITEREEFDPDALKIEFTWNAGYRECQNWFSVIKETEDGDIEISYHRRTGERITVIDCK